AGPVGGVPAPLFPGAGCATRRAGRRPAEGFDCPTSGDIALCRAGSGAQPCGGTSIAPRQANGHAAEPHRPRAHRVETMIQLQPMPLEGHGVRLEPLAPEHGQALRRAAADGRLWELWYTSVPEPDGVEAYIAAALAGQE